MAGRSVLAASVVLSVATVAWAHQIPLCPGLTIVTAVNQPDGDYESIKTVQSVAPDGVRIKYSSERPDNDILTGTGELKRTTVFRTVLVKDLESATQYQQVFLEKSDETIPGTTAIGTSSAVLKAVKSKGESELRVSFATSVNELTADREKRPNYYDYLLAGKVQRVGTARLPVLVNNALVELPAIQVQGEIGYDKDEFFFLDDERNPLTLKFRLGIGGLKPIDPQLIPVCEGLKRGNVPLNQVPGCLNPKGGDRDILRVVKISYNCSGAPLDLGGGAGSGAGGLAGGGAAPTGGGALEKALAETGKADIYSIYFSFNSDVIREESEPMLDEIAEVLRNHPEWKLGVTGHTDNIASDTYNLALSQRRAAAVKSALVTRYRIDAVRLSASGAGESSPKDTNETLEGRARNRRVELVRAP
jgi:hypothetical protein